MILAKVLVGDEVTCPGSNDRLVLDAGPSVLTAIIDVLKLHHDVCHSMHLEWGGGGFPYLHPGS